MTRARFVSPEGAAALADLRVGATIEPTGGLAPVRLLARLPSDDCGCPEELWTIDGVLALIHFEADGAGELILWAGDWEDERRLAARTMPELRAAMFAAIAALPEEAAP